MAFREMVLVSGIVAVAMYAQATNSGKLVAVKTMGWSKDKAGPTPSSAPTAVATAVSTTKTPPPVKPKGITEKGVK